MENHLDSYLTEGVLMHPFSDSSGSVFFNNYSGETLSIRMTVEAFQSSIDEYLILSSDDRPLNLIHSLVEKHFITI